MNCVRVLQIYAFLSEIGVRVERMKAPQTVELSSYPLGVQRWRPNLTQDTAYNAEILITVRPSWRLMGHRSTRHDLLKEEAPVCGLESRHRQPARPPPHLRCELRQLQLARGAPLNEMMEVLRNATSFPTGN